MYYVYGKKGCSYCASALTLLKNYRCSAKYFEIEKNEVFVDFLKRVYNCKTYPMIFYNKNYIGGFQELENSLNF